MPQSRTGLERQLSRATAALSERVKTLDDRGVAPADRRRDAKWRNLNSVCSDLQGRLRRVGELEQLVDEVARRKAERAQALSEPKQDKKASKKSSGKSKKKQKEK